MNLIQLIACIGLITGCFVLLHISPMDFTEGVFRRITSKPKSIRSEVNESTPVSYTHLTLPTKLEV